MDKAPAWVIYLVPILGSATGVFMALVAFFTLKEKHAESQLALYRETFAQRVAGLEREVALQTARVAELERELARCRQQVDLLTGEKYDLLMRLLSSRPPQ